MDARRQSTPPGTSSRDPLQILIDAGISLAGERNLDTIIHNALEAGRELAQAHVAIFFYTSTGEDGGPVQLYKFTSGSGADPGLVAELNPAPSSIPRADIFDDEHFGNSILRAANIRTHPLFGGRSPFHGTPLSAHPVQSFLSIPVLSRIPSQSASKLGGMLFGHADPDIFSDLHEAQLTTLAAQACAAIETARLAQTLTQEIALADAARQLQRETAERLSSVFDSTTDGIVLMDRDWRYTYINKRARDLMALPQTIIGQRYQDVFPAVRGSIFETRYREVMETQQPIEFTDFSQPLNIWAAVRVFPTAEGLAIFFQDVTAQRRAERQSEDATRRLSQALEAGQLGTWTWNRETDMLDLDERAAYLLDADGPHVPISRTQLRNRIVLEEDKGQTAESMRDIVLAGGNYNAEYRMQTRDGRQVWIASRGIMTYADEPGTASTADDRPARKITGMIGTVQDITARKTQETALRQTEKLAATGRLAATIAHEINNPLEAVTNLIYLSKTDPGVPPAIQDLLEAADSELARVAQIAQQTLGFYRDTTRPLDIDLSALLEGVVNLFSRKMVYKKINCELDIHPNLHIFGLQGEVRQVFSNLLVNAIDATAKNLIRVRARAVHSMGRTGVSVLIADHGTGIPSAVRNRLFSPFFTTKESVGTGLGLWVTRGIVEKQGGSILFRSSTESSASGSNSTEKRHGTVFRVFLPTEFPSPEKFSPASTNLIQ